MIRLWKYETRSVLLLTRGRDCKDWLKPVPKRSEGMKVARSAYVTLKSASLQCKLGTRKCYAFLAFFAKQKATLKIKIQNSIFVLM